MYFLRLKFIFNHLLKKYQSEAKPAEIPAIKGMFLFVLGFLCVSRPMLPIVPLDCE